MHPLPQALGLAGQFRPWQSGCFGEKFLFEFGLGVLGEGLCLIDDDHGLLPVQGPGFEAVESGGERADQFVAFEDQFLRRLPRQRQRTADFGLDVHPGQALFIAVRSDRVGLRHRPCRGVTEADDQAGFEPFCPGNKLAGRDQGPGGFVVRQVPGVHLAERSGQFAEPGHAVFGGLEVGSAVAGCFLFPPGGGFWVHPLPQALGLAGQFRPWQSRCFGEQFLFESGLGVFGEGLGLLDDDHGLLPVQRPGFEAVERRRERADQFVALEDQFLRRLPCQRQRAADLGLHIHPGKVLYVP